MLVVDLQHMERIVDANPDLNWDGWNVVKYTKNASAFMSTDGVFINGGWFKKKTYPLTESGWTIPNGMVKT